MATEEKNEIESNKKGGVYRARKQVSEQAE